MSPTQVNGTTLNVYFLSAVSEASQTSYLSNTISSLIGCIIPILALIYFSFLSWTYRYSQRHSRPLNKVSGVRLQRYAPAVYIFAVICSLVEMALASWLLLQYRFHRNFPNVQARTGTRLLLFSACWTALTAGAYSVLFLHPSWSKHPVSSVGSQAIWVFITWLLWSVGSGLLNAAIPALLVGRRCTGLVYCGQIQALFAIGVLEVLTLTAGMLTLIWLAWQSTREIVQRGLPRLPQGSGNSAR